MNRVLSLASAICAAVSTWNGCHAAGTMVEIAIAGATRTGSVVAHNAETGWFLERDGRLTLINLGDVTDYKPLGAFRPFSSVELRERLSLEFGRKFSVASTAHYLVVTARGVDARYGALFENLYREFVVSFTSRGFRMQEPEFPLVAIVFPDEAGFFEYCRSENVEPQAGLRGYYLPSSNRVALYESADAGSSAVTGLDRTILHEAVHQVAFNTGIHSRRGANPKWVVEGLATAFEVSAVRNHDRSGSPRDRSNAGRLEWFQQSRERRSANAIAELVSGDELFTASPLDAYAESWALTFYLLENSSAEYTRYLKHLAVRDPFQSYSAAERLADFQKYFGRDVSLLEARHRRFFDNLAASGE